MKTPGLKQTKDIWNKLKSTQIYHYIQWILILADYPKLAKLRNPLKPKHKKPPNLANPPHINFSKKSIKTRFCRDL